MSELDVALERFQRTAPEFGPGLANHGPMVCEAQAVLGHEALIPAYVERYAPRLPPLLPGRPIPLAERAAALGSAGRAADWIASYEAALGERPWRKVLAEAAAALAPGLFASAGHGWLRTAHAARALAGEDSPLRRRELAHGLGLWAARYQELPGRPGRASAGRREPRLAGVAPIDASARQPGLFSDAVRVLAGDADFPAWVEGLDLDGSALLSLVGGVCREAAHLYLAHPAARVAYAHVVSVPSALRLVAPHLPAPLLRALLGHAIQAAAALHAVSCAPAPPGPERSAAERIAGDAAEIRYRAACSLDDHAVKLAEACLREDAAEPAPVLRLAAADAALHLGGPQRHC